MMNTKFGKISLNDNGYYRVYSWKEGNRGKMFHKLVWEDFYGCKVPEGYIIHHKNGNKQDNCILNLQLMSFSNHSIHHNRNRGVSLETKLKQSKNMNTTGYFRVSKYHFPYKDDFIWRYSYRDENKKQQAIYSKTIIELEEKVLDKGLEWRELNGGS